MRLFEGTEFDMPPRCDRCERLEEECDCPPPPPDRAPPEEQTANVMTEKRKKGKIVTLVSGLSEPQTDLAALAKALKDFCGAGGSLKNDIIEVQGEHLARVCEKLESIGYRVKRR